MSESPELPKWKDLTEADRGIVRRLLTEKKVVIMPGVTLSAGLSKCFIELLAPYKNRVFEVLVSEGDLAVGVGWWVLWDMDGHSVYRLKGPDSACPANISKAFASEAEAVAARNRRSSWASVPRTRYVIKYFGHGEVLPPTFDFGSRKDG